MVSLKDIAERCGVSTATVSKALNDHKDVGAKTKERIRQIANEMGYFPNSAAIALKTNRTYNIGVLFVDLAQSGLVHDYFNHVLDSFKRSVEDKGYDMTFINASKNAINTMTYLEHVRYRNFDGVIIACVDFFDPEVVELVNSDIPVITIDHIFHGCNAVLSNNAGGIEKLINYANDKGHKKIAYIHGEGTAVTQERLSSFHRTTEELGLKIPDEYVRSGKYRDSEVAYQNTKELLAMKNRPTCIMYSDDFAALGGIKAIQEEGLSIPKDISIIGFDGIRLTRHIDPKLTTLVQDTEAIGRKAAIKLIEQIEKPKSSLVEYVTVNGELYEGGSVADITG